MTKYKINLTEAPDEISHDCPFGRGNDLTHNYDFESELDILIYWLNLEVTSISCQKFDNTSVIVESEISSIDELQAEMQPVFNKIFCYIRYDNKNPMTII